MLGNSVKVNILDSFIITIRGVLVTSNDEQTIMLYLQSIVANLNSSLFLIRLYASIRFLFASKQATYAAGMDVTHSGLKLTTAGE